LKTLGLYFIFLGQMLSSREKFKVYVNRTLDECILIGIDSIFIVAIVSSFIGAVTCIQTEDNLVASYIPKYVISLIVRDMTILELAPTITCVVLSGKVGSNIAGELGTMRVKEQIDALDVMGINAASYLVLPKIAASIIVFPMLVTLAGFLSIFGGYVAGVYTGIITPEQYIYGLRSDFRPQNVPIALIKAVAFAFLISTISAFQGFYTKGGALEVGQSSTKAVTNSCIAVLLADYLLAQLLI
jgi:phospholipid/cholesterol/gamma-HCH transport system permease protein